MPAVKKTAAPAKTETKKAPVSRLDEKLAAAVVKLRDEDKKPWNEISQETGKTGPQLRRLYNAGRKLAAGTEG